LDINCSRRDTGAGHVTHMGWRDMHLGFSKEAGRKKTTDKSYAKIKG